MLKQSFPGFNLLIEIKKETSLAVQWLRLHLSIQEAWIQSLVRELKTHILQDVAKNFKILK